MENAPETKFNDISEDTETKDARRLKIIHQMIMETPPGQLKEVFGDLRILMNNDDLLQKGCGGILQRYNEEQFTTVVLPNQYSRAIVCQHAFIAPASPGEGRYLDYSEGVEFTFNHNVKVVKEATMDDRLEKYRNELDSLIQVYVLNHYPEGVCTTFCKQHDNSEIDLICCIVSDCFRLSNYWAGKWRSEWTFRFKENSIEGNLKGLITLNVHYFEDGNVQLESHKEFEQKIGIDTEANINIGTTLTQHISKAENGFHGAVNEVYTQLPETTFKELRRTLPVIRNKLDWSKIFAYKIGSELAQH